MNSINRLTFYRIFLRVPLGSVRADDAFDLGVEFHQSGLFVRESTTKSDQRI
jgi:hypothetical protein